MSQNVKLHGSGNLTLSRVNVRHGKPSGTAIGGGIFNNAGDVALDEVLITAKSAARTCPDE